MGKWAAHLAQSQSSVSWDIYLFGFAGSSLLIAAEVRQMMMMIWSSLAGAFDVRYCNIRPWMSDVCFKDPRFGDQSTSFKTTID